MKKIVFLLITLICCNILLAQHVTVANTKMNILYVGIDNPISITVENYDCDDLVIESTNGSIEKLKECLYNVRTKSEGEVIIVVKTEIDGKISTLEKFAYRSKRIPPPVAEVARRSGGELSKGEFKVQNGVRVVLKDFDICANYSVTNYSCIIVRSNTKNAEFIDSSSTSIFTAKMKSAFNEIQAGDEVIFYNIIVKGPDESEMLLESIKFDIIK